MISLNFVDIIVLYHCHRWVLCLVNFKKKSYLLKYTVTKAIYCHICELHFPGENSPKLQVVVLIIVQRVLISGISVSDL